ncbi:MAG: EamA family transporter [Bacteroidales bacterium]
MNFKNPILKGHIAIFFADVIWGLNAPVSKAALGHVSSLSLTTFRMTGAALAFSIFSFFVSREKVATKDKVRLFFAALFGVVINQGFFVLGLSYTSPVNAAIVTTTLPIVTMIFAAMYLKEPITNKKVFGILLGAIGAVILIMGSGGGFSLTGSVKGDLFCLLAQISVAVYLTLFKDLFVRYSPVTVLTWMFCYASLCFLPVSWHDIIRIPYKSLPLNAYLEISFVVFAGTFIAYLGMMTAQKYLRPTVVSIYNYVQPVVASIVAVLAGMDTFGPAKVAAVILVFAGVYFVTQSKSRAQVEALAAVRRDKDKDNSCPD